MSNEALNAYRSARDKQLVRNEARHIRSKINDARGSRHDAGVRWPFELLQNALDAGPRPGREFVEARLHDTGKQFVFEHDGAFFAPSDLAALLSGGSNKEFESEDTTGRFGTGFLVTHVLTPHTEISGIFRASTNLERFSLILDRGGDEDSIVENIAACDVAVQSAIPLTSANGIPSASFTYVTDDDDTLRLGIDSFRTAVPYLFATCERLGRVIFDIRGHAVETWEAGPTASSIVNGVMLRDRSLSCHQNGQSANFRAIRVALPTSPDHTAVAVLSGTEGHWRLLIPSHEFPRVFRRYPIRTSAFLPINAILDAPFDLDQERRRLLLDKEDVKTVFQSAMGAVLPLVSLAFKEGWGNRHLLARAAPSSSSFAEKEDRGEMDWLTGEMRHLAEQLARLPLVATRNGLGVASDEAQAEWYADFVDADADGTVMKRLWPLVDEAEDLYPPVAELAEPWVAIARGWHELGVKVSLISLTALAEYVSKGANHVEQLRVRGDKREWLTRFLDVVGESWAKNGVNAKLLDGMLPNQHGAIVARKDLSRDEGISDALKEIAEALGWDVRSELADSTILKLARQLSFEHVATVLESAVPGVMTEDDVLDECVQLLEKRFPKSEQLAESNRTLILGSIRLLDYLVKKGDAAVALASRMPLLACDGTFARTSTQRKLMSPVQMWDERARAFQAAYPSDRLLAEEYVETTVVSALVKWGIAFADPLIKMTPSDPIKGDRLRCLAIESEATEGIQIQGEEFMQVALLHELMPRCQSREEAALLLGLAVCYLAPADISWRDTRVVTGRRAGADVSVTVTGALWLADLRARAWVPVPSDEGRTSQVVATPDSLKSLLDPVWLTGNTAAIELLGRCFGFDSLDLQLFIAPDDLSRKVLRDQLARIVELANADPSTLIEVEVELQAKRQRALHISRCRKLGLDIQDAIKEALEAQGLKVQIIDIGYDFEVSYVDLDDAGVQFEVGSHLVEVKATTTGDAKLTPKQAATASQAVDRYVLCVVDLRGTPVERLDQPWDTKDVLPLAYLVPQVGALVRGTWALVEEAKISEVGLRNENALRYVVPPDVWEGGLSIKEWVRGAFKDAIQ